MSVKNVLHWKGCSRIKGKKRKEGKSANGWREEENRCFVRK